MFRADIFYLAFTVFITFLENSQQHTQGTPFIGLTGRNSNSNSVQGSGESAVDDDSIAER